MMDSSRTRITPKLLFKLFCILPIICQYVTIAVAAKLDDDSLESALEAIERRQRDLQIREDYGQPENIGYGFQKNMGFFEPAPARHLGASVEPDDFGFVSAARDSDDFQDEGPAKRERSNFRQRTVQPSDGLEYLEALRGLWDKYQQQHSQALDLEDLSDEEVAEMLSALEAENAVYDDQRRARRNYRVFDNTNQKRSPSFGQGLYGKRSAQRLSYETPPSDAFLYSLKWVNPAMNREGVEGLRGSDPYTEERDRDVLSVLNSRPRYANEGIWMTGPNANDEVEVENEQRLSRPGPYWSRDRKRAPVKRNVNRVRKETTDEEVKGIFGTEAKKQNVTQVKKVVRRAEPNRPGEISDLFHVQKKNIDWSKHFGVNKRMPMYANPFDTRVFNTKRNLADNLDAVENRIGGVEEQILADTVKFTGAHADRGLDAVRPEIVRRLEAAYSLEKMRAALEDFKNSVNSGVTETPVSSTTDGKTDKADKAKRVAVKKEGVGPDNEAEFLNWQRSAAPAPDGACPLLEQLVDNCMRMEEILGKFGELLTPACTLHQICYSCGPEFGFSRRASCDLMFLSEAQHLCQDKPECLGGAREAVLALRDEHGRATPAATCRANPCVADHFLTSPSGVVSLSLP